MKYSVPVNAACEVAALVAAGADELYCGFQDAWWASRYGDHDSASRRQGAANLATMEELWRTAQAAQACGVPLYLALNARYTEPQLEHLVELCDAFVQMGGVGVIASDVGLLWRLRDRSDLARTLSLLAVAQNAPTLQAFGELGVMRVVFPRFIGPDEASKLLAAVPGMQGEVMAFFDKCPLVDGYCRHRHGISHPDRQVGEGSQAEAAQARQGLRAEAAQEFVDNSDASSSDVSGGGDKLAGVLPRSDLGTPLFTFDTTYRTHACLGTSCNYLEPYPCGACFLAQFESAGVGFAKLGGRGRPLEERLRALRFLKQAEVMRADDERRFLYRQTFGQECACYYGEAVQNRYAIEPVESPPESSDWHIVGSQTSFAAFRASVERCIAEAGDGVRDESDSAGARRTAVLIPPLSDEGLDWLCAVMPALARGLPQGAFLCANDLGTLIAISKMNRELALGLRMSAGTLLARVDNPAEIAHFTDPQDNPSRLVWDSQGRPRVLEYAPPSEELLRHWRQPSATEPSTQAALHALTGERGVPYGFADMR